MPIPSFHVLITAMPSSPLVLFCLAFGAISPHAFCLGGVDLGNGFTDHGVAVPVSHHRGTVATSDGKGHNVLLSWLSDHRGGYELLLIDVDAGKAEDHPMPFPTGDYPYASILSSRNKFYTHFNRRFVEFDPASRTFAFCKETQPQMAMSMTEDEHGVIWSATYPNCGLVSFDPSTRELKDHGYLNKENWLQYTRSIAADDAGWIYIGLGSTNGQIVAFNPQTRTTTPLVPEGKRSHGYCTVYRDLDGKVYGNPDPAKPDNCAMLDQGKATPIGKRAQPHPKPFIAGDQGLFHNTFPDGSKVETFSLVDREFAVGDPKTGKKKAFHFDYASQGAPLMGVIAAPDGTICGGTAFPMRFFRFDPRKNEWIHREAFGQWNTVARQGKHLFVGAYGGGVLLEWDPAKPWVPTVAESGCPETIGWGYSGKEHYHFKGLIDDLKIFDKALSSAEIDKGPPPGLLAHWAFDEGEGEIAKDTSGNGNHGKSHGARRVPGKSRGALLFNGLDAFVEIPDSPSLRAPGAITVDAWIFPQPPHQGGYGGILNNIAGHSNSRLLVLNSGGTLAQVAIGCTQQHVTGPAVKNNAWNRVTYTFDGASERWIVNGVEGPKFPKQGQIWVESNPAFLTESAPTINRPHKLLAHPDGKTVVLAGTPGYGYTGGGLLFWDGETKKSSLLTHDQILPMHSTMSLAALPGGKLLGGSTTAPGTGGERKAVQAELYILELASKKIEWHQPAIPEAQEYTDLCTAPDGLVYGFADRRRFFVFDPAKRAVIHQELLDVKLGQAVSQQGPRSFVTGPKGEIYVLLTQGIARVTPRTYQIERIATSPVPIGSGGDYLDGRIYFGAKSHLYSFKLPH